MKKIRRRLATILAMVMVITSFTFLGVYADPTDPPADPTDVTLTGGEGGEGEEDLKPEKVTGLEAFSSYESIVLLWDKVDDPTIKYLVNGKPVTPDTYVTPRTNKTMNRYDITGVAPGEYRYATVVAYREDSEMNRYESPVAGDGDVAVRTIAYRVRIKKSGTLKSHGGPSRTIRVSKGEYIDCYGFGGGKYIFERNGSIFYCNKTRTNKRSCVYTNAFNYSRQDAEFYIEAKRRYDSLSSPTNSLIWVNTFTQHLYRFDYRNGRWECVNDFECSTGKAATPSPTGVNGKKQIWKKISKRHKIKWWSPYSDINSIHAKKAKWRIGYPSSNGCIRNYENNAYDVYVNAPIGTRVLLYQ